MIREVETGLLYTGDAGSARDLKQLYDREFSAVVDLAADEPPAVLGRDLIYCRFPLSDDGSNRDALIASALVCLNALLERDLRTLLACGAGMSRSPVLAAAAIAMRSGEPLPDCLARLAARAPVDVPPTFFAAVARVCAELSP